MDIFFHFFLVFFVSSFFIGTQVNGFDPCKAYQEINDPYRSTKSTLTPGIRANCDFNLRKGWYRFTSIVGGQIPTTKPKPFHCNTIAPVWIKDELPKTKGKQKTVTACVNLFNLDEGCKTKFGISVKYCDGEGGEDFYVYKLKPTRGCAKAYCAGDKTPCRRGFTGIKPNCNVSKIVEFPSFLVPRPKLDYVKNKFALAMSCKFDPPTWNNVSYLVEWFANGKLIRTQRMCVDEKGGMCDRNNLESIINYEAKLFKMGQNLQCRIKMKYTTSPHNKWSIPKYSNIFYVGIEVTPRQIVVKECERNKDEIVTLRPTIPIHENPLIPESDYLNISIRVPTTYKNQRRQAAVDTCSVSLRTEDISSGKTIKIKGICDDPEDGVQELKFSFDHGATFDPWLGYRPPSLLVRVDTTDSSVCTATGDPHYKTFDIRKFNFYKSGVYLMYSNERKRVQVHVRLWTCNPGVSCNCGVAIREKNDVVVFSVCNDVLEKGKGEMTPIEISMPQTEEHKPFADGFYINPKSQGSSMEYNVFLPSGTRITISRTYWGMNILITAPGTDKGQVSGLCGNFNGNPDDDLIGKDGKRYTDEQLFGSTWHIPYELSYFEIAPTSIPPITEGESCTCPTEKSKKITDCKKTTNNFNEMNFQLENPIYKIWMMYKKKITRSVDDPWYSDDIIDHERRSYFVDDPQVHKAMNRIRSKRSLKTLMSKEEATKYCRSHIEETKAGRSCKDVTGESIGIAMEQCIVDLELTGDPAYVYSAFEFMAYECKVATFKNVSLYTKSPDGDLVPPTKVLEDLCPADCSGHGRCKNKTCICDEGFTAPDCSMDVNAVPEVLGIYNGGLCDLRERPCRKTNMMGQNFISSENLTCHVEEIEVYAGPWSPRGHPVKLHGDMYDLYGVKCDLPEPPTRLDDYDHEGTPAGGLLISVSNDGFNTSVQKLRHVSYDSKCINCSNSSTCERKANSCLIRGHCFAANEPNPRDWCQQCLPRDDQNSWTPRKNNHAPKFTTKTTMFAVRGEDLLIQLKATDPDNRPVTYSLLSSTATGHTLSSSGLLRWNVTSNEKFTFKVTDECGAFDTTDMRVRIVQCPCLNAGQCVPHPYHPRGSGKYQCKCRDKFSGELCEMCKGIRNNKPPKFTSQRNIFALQGEDLSLQLKAEDPEKMSITYSLLSSTVTGHTLSSSGLLRWWVTSNSSFTIKVTDECDTFDTIEMTLRIVQCPCFNVGKCVPHRNHPRGSGKYQCKCVNGFRGVRCERCPGFVCPARNVTVKAIGSTKLEVNWLGPSDNLLTYYFVKYAQQSYGFRSEQVPKTITTKTLNNLKKFTDYRVAVSVVNRYGEKMVETMVKTGEDVPDAAPVITNVSPERYDTMLVSWSLIPKHKRNGIIVGYKIYYRQQYTDDAWNSTTTSTGDLTSTAVTGLQPYTEYCVKMSAFTSKGECPDWGRKQCYPVKTPSLPVKVFGEAISWNEIRLRFEKPKHSISSNKVQVDYGKVKRRLKRKKACRGSSCVIDSLEPNTLYYFKVIGYVYQRGETPSFTQIRTLSRG